MLIRIFNSKNINEYNNLIKNLNLDIYYNGNYLKIEADKIKGKLEIFCSTQENYIFIYPYIKLKINNKFSDYYDLISPYGYCGPYCNNSIFFENSEKKFINYKKY